MSLKFSTLTFGLLAIAAMSPAQITKQGGGYLFRLKFVAGANYKYDMAVTQGAAGAPGIAAKIPFTQKVQSVSGDTATMTFTVGPISYNGQVLLKPTTATAKVTRTGKVVGASPTGGQGVTVFPAGPVRPGSTWSAPIPLGNLGAPGTSKANATYSFVGVKNVGGKSLAQLAVTLLGSGQTKLSGGGTTYINVADGSLQSSELTLSVSGARVQGQPTGAMKMHISIHRK